MASKRVVSDRRRSRPVTKQKATHKIKKNKPAMALAIFIILMLVFSTFYVVFSSFSGNNESSTSSYKNDPEYINALAGTGYPVAVIELSNEKAIAIELYTDKMPATCQNFVNLVKSGFYDGMIFHRVMDNFMIQAGKMYPDESTSTSPYGNIIFEDSDVTHVDGAISMASTGDRVGGSAEFFIRDGAQHGLDGRYAAFGKTIYGIKYVREISAEPQDGSSGAAGGGRPFNDIIIKSIKIVKE